MYKGTRKFLSILLVICMTLSFMPGEIPVTGSVSAEVGDASVVAGEAPVAAESAVIAPEDTVALLGDCQILRYVNEAVFREKNHVSRVTAEETLSSYVFQNEDGSRTVYFLDEPVKYEDSSGVVREKDLTLQAVTADGALALSASKAVAGYTTTANDIGLTLPVNPSEGISLTYRGAGMRLIPLGGGRGVTAQMADGAVTYPDFYGAGMSLRYTPSLSGVKEDIILEAYTGVNTFTFLLNTDGLGLYENNGRYYLAQAAGDETRMELGDLVTFDAHGRFSLGTTTVETLTPNQSYRLTLTVDQTFLTAETTAYPVTIDPTLTVSDNTHGANAIEDATVYGGIPSLNTGSWMYHHIGIYDDEYGDGRTVFRLKGLLQSSIYQNLSAEQITSATFYVKEASGNADGIVYLFSMDSDTWTESGITWNNMGTFRGIPYATQTLRSGQTTGFNITDLVKAWKNGTRSGNAGFVLRANYDNPAAKGIYSSEYSTNSYRPYAVLTYSMDVWLDRNVSNIPIGSSTSLTANTAQSDATVTWTSSDTSVASVSSTRNNTCRVTTVNHGVAIITARLSNGQTDSCTVYAYMSNGVYFLRCNGSLYLSVNGGMVSGSRLTLQEKKTADIARLRQLWKFEHIGQHYYSIRSLYRPDLALIATDDGIVEMATLSTSLSGNSIPHDRRWTITYSNGCYSFQYVGTSSLSLQPSSGSMTSGNSVIAAMASVHSNVWSMDYDTSSGNQVLLINSNTGQPASGSIREIASGRSHSLSDMAIMAVFISPYTNFQNIQWRSANISVAAVDQSTGAVTGVLAGHTAITASYTYNGSMHTASYIIKVSPIPEGIYYIRNREYGKYIQPVASDASNNYSTSGAALEMWSYNGGDHQKWRFSFLGDGYYSIISVKSGLALSVPSGQTTTMGSRFVQEPYQGADRQKWEITQSNSHSYLIKSKSSEGLSSNLVMGVTACNYASSSDEYIEQCAYVEDSLYRDEWQICSFVDIGFSTDNYSGGGDRERQSYLYANTFYNGLNAVAGSPISKTHRYNKDSTYTAAKFDFSQSGAISNAIDFMIYIGHGHTAHDLGDGYVTNHIQYSYSTQGAIHPENVCNASNPQGYKDSFCLYTSEVEFGSASSDLRWVWMYTCNFLTPNDYVTDASLKEMMTGAHILMGNASTTTLCNRMVSLFSSQLRAGEPIIDAYFYAGTYGEVYEADSTHTQKVLYVPQFEYETIYSPRLYYEYDSTDVRIVTNTFEGKK